MAGEAAKGQRLKFRRFRARNRLFPLLLSSINLSESCRIARPENTTSETGSLETLSSSGRVSCEPDFLDRGAENIAERDSVTHYAQL